MNAKKLALALAAVLGLSVAGTGCHTGGPYVQAWYDVYGYQCGSGAPRAGCNYYWDGTKIRDYEDPYYSSSNQFYYGQWDYVDSYGYWQTFYGYAWLSPTGVLYDDYGNALNEEGASDSRDLIGDVAKAEEQLVTKVGKEFAAKHALSESTGVAIARTLNDWATLSKKQSRSRTQADVADFSKRLYGVTLDKTTVALDKAKSGDMSGLTAVNADIASHWGTTPETSKAILKGWYKNELTDYGVN
jgi:hypothetical protein